MEYTIELYVITKYSKIITNNKMIIANNNQLNNKVR